MATGMAMTPTGSVNNGSTSKTSNVRVLKPKPVIDGLRGAAKVAHVRKIVPQIRETIEAARPVGVVSATTTEGWEIERQQRERERFERNNPLCGAGSMFGGCDKPTPIKEIQANDGFCFDCREKQIEQNQKRERDERKATQKAAFQKRQSLLESLGGKLPKIRLTADQYKELKSIEVEYGTKRAKRAYEDMVIQSIEIAEETQTSIVSKKVEYTTNSCSKCREVYALRFLKPVKADDKKGKKFCPTCREKLTAEKPVQPVKPQAVVTSKRKLAAIAKNGVGPDGRPLSRATRKNATPAAKPEKPSKPNRRGSHNTVAERQR